MCLVDATSTLSKYNGKDTLCLIIGDLSRGKRKPRLRVLVAEVNPVTDPNYCPVVTLVSKVAVPWFTPASQALNVNFSYFK